MTDRIALVDGGGAVVMLIPAAADLSAYAMEGLTARPATAADEPVVPPAAPRLTPFQVLNLFTIAERAAARRLIDARFPEGHPKAGDLIDPAGVVQVLLDSLIAAQDPIALDSSYHLGGVAMLQQFGILTAARAARVLAGLPPALDP